MSKFQIVKGITDNLTETPYVEGKVYFVYDDINSTDLSIYADIDGARRKITPTTFEEEDPKIHILTLQEDENGELTTGEDESISGYVNNNELVIIYYVGMPYFYINNDRGLYFGGINGNTLLRYYSTTENKMVWRVNNDYYLTQYDLPTNVSQLNNDAGYITQETDPTVPSWAKETTKPTYTAAEVGALPDTTVIPEDKIFIATYGTTTYADTLEAYNAGKLIFAVYSNSDTGKIILPLTRKISSEFQFEGHYVVGRSEKRICTLSSSRWTTTWLQGDTVIRTVDIASGDSLIIRDLDDNSTMKSSSLAFGTETNQYLANNGTWQTVPENTSDLTNDSGFQTSTEVNSAIATAIGNINQFNVAIVSTLPIENIDTHTIYFMSNGGSDDNIYDEWMYINDNWEKIGTTSIDLSGYMQTSHPANGIASTDIDNWNNKADLWDIASGVGSSGSSNAFSININNYFSHYGTNINFMVFVNKQQLINNPTQIQYTTNSEHLEIKKDNIIIDGAVAGSLIEPGLYYGTLSNWSNSATLTLTKAPITSDIPTVPTTVSSFTNDSGYLTSYTETDPTVPAWAKAANKPAYTATEVGAVPEFVGNIDSHNSRISSTPTSISIRQDNDSDPASSVTLNTSGIELSVGGRVGNNKINLTQTGTTIHNIVTPTADMDAANKKYVDDSIAGITIPTKVSDLTNDSGFISSYTETDPIFSASAAAGITNTDINNWNAKVSDDKTWNGVTLDKTTGMGGSNIYVPYTTSANASKMNYWTVSQNPINYAIAKYDSSSYLYSTTPSANDNSTKVATTAYVDAAIPNVSGYISNITYDATNRELKKTINGTTSTIVDFGTAAFKLVTTTVTSDGSSLPTSGAVAEYVGNKVPKVYSSTNTNGYLTMATLPIYDGTVE